jgi:hypothetical protein
MTKRKPADQLKKRGRRRVEFQLRMPTRMPRRRPIFDEPLFADAIDPTDLESMQVVQALNEISPELLSMAARFVRIRMGWEELHTMNDLRFHNFLCRCAQRNLEAMPWAVVFAFIAGHYEAIGEPLNSGTATDADLAMLVGMRLETFVDMRKIAREIWTGARQSKDFELSPDWAFGPNPERARIREIES